MITDQQADALAKLYVGAEMCGAWEIADICTQELNAYIDNHVSRLQPGVVRRLLQVSCDTVHTRNREQDGEIDHVSP